MPYDSLVGMGNRRPQAYGGTNMPLPIECPSHAFLPDEAKPVPLPALVDGTAPTETRTFLDRVEIKPPTVRLHPAWQQTSLGAAIDARGHLDLNAVAPQMLRALPPVARRSLYAALSRTEKKIVWIDAEGDCHRRRPLWGTPFGRRWRVNGATALVLRMAQAHDPDAFAEALYDALLVSVDELQGASAKQHFTAADVAQVVEWVVAEILADPNPALVEPLCDATATLLRHYIQGISCGQAQGLVEGMVRLTQTLRERLPPAGAPHGIAMGLTVSAGFRYASLLGGADSRRRWWVASYANLLWAASNFIPIPTAAGAVALGVVSGAIWWDYTHAPRAYADVVRRFEGRYALLAETGQLPMAASELQAMLRWMQIVGNLTG